MNFGEVGHEKNPAYTKFVCYLVEKLRMLQSKPLRRKAFNDLTVNTTYDVNQLEIDVKARFKTPI